MVRDLLTERPESGTSSDVCIVGAGAAGIVLAIELLRYGRSVTMLEGGGAAIEAASQGPYRSELAGLPHRGIHTGRYRAVGGTTTKWGGQILELDERDFEARAGIALSGWPIAKKELMPHYERALEIEGLAGVNRDDDAVWNEIGLRRPTFDCLETYCSRWCPQPNFAVLHRETLERHPGLTVWRHANAVGLEFNTETLTGIRARTLTGIEVTFRAREYVFCMGAIESSRFFLQPQAGDVPWNRSGLLGKHFQDHIDCNAATVVPLDVARFHAAFDNVFSKGFKYHPKLRLVASKQAEFHTLNVAGTMNFVSDADDVIGNIKRSAKHLLRGQLAEIEGSDLMTLAKNLPLLVRQTWRYGVQHRAYNPPDATIILRVHCEQQPDSSSSIMLSDERDALGMLRTKLDWRISTLELETVLQYVLVAQSSLATLARVEPNAALSSHDPSFVTQCDDSNHHMGGMRMAGSETEGLVDANLRLYGLWNAYICSAAVFPTSGHSNPTHTLLALAVRLAEHLATLG
jgi:choline dehydrogenase-like flavoprotein